ncbi:NAD(+)/NADH kinase [Methylocella sp.]|uniref:NAD(+)/NADH kinase n=1 Tax=Methylocella sp. TaxID=1978226 RepID=UPI0035AEF937
MTPVVGIIANPFSARDVRRVVAQASGVQIADRANAVMRALAGLAAGGVGEVLMMPDRAGPVQSVERTLDRAARRGGSPYPRLSVLDMPVRSAVEDAHVAARMMARANVAAILALGGDGAHRAVVAHCGTTPLAAISTGANNAFAELREPTVVGLATALAATGQAPEGVAFRANKLLEAKVNGEAHVALVDVAVVSDSHVGAKALWRVETFRELYVAFADPDVIGMAAIAGLLEPVSRREPAALRVRLLAPGLVAPVAVAGWSRLLPGETARPALKAGTLAFDGEREVSFQDGDAIAIALRENAFRSVDVGACMAYAATQGLMRAAAAPTVPQQAAATR